MKNLMLWYLPQAALFLVSVTISHKMDPPISGQSGAIVGVMLAGAYTALVMIVLDARPNWRGLTERRKAAMKWLAGGLFVAPFLVSWASGERLATAFLAMPFLAVLWLLLLAFVAALPSRLRSHSSQSSRDSERLTGAGRLLGDGAQQRQRIGIDKDLR